MGDTGSLKLLNGSVDIVMAVFRPNLKYFKEQIESIKNQTFTNWVCIVTDDSRDHIIREQILEILVTDSRFHYYEHLDSPRGSVNNFCSGLSRVRKETQFVAFSDQDDVWDAQKLELQVQELLDNPEITLIHHDLSIIDQDGHSLASSCWALENRFVLEQQPPEFLRINLVDLVMRNRVTGCSMMFVREILDYAMPIPWQEKPVLYHHDLWVALHAARIGFIRSSPRVLLKYRQHGENVVGASSKTFLSSLLSLFRFFHLIGICQFQYRSRLRLVQDFKDSLHQRSPLSVKIDEKNLDYCLNFWPLVSYYFPRAIRSIQWLKMGFLLGFGALLEKLIPGRRSMHRH